MPGMHAYRCYLIDVQSHIGCAKVVECVDDDEAKLRAREILAEKPGYRAIEVWDGGRRVYVHPSGADPAGHPIESVAR